MQKIINNLKLNSGSFLEFFVLKILSERTHSLREIYDKLKSLGFRTPKGSLYPLFTIFRRNKFVISGYEESDFGGAEKTYSLTDRGRERLIELKRDWKQLESFVAHLG